MRWKSFISGSDELLVGPMMGSGVIPMVIKRFETEVGSLGKQVNSGSVFGVFG